MTIRVLPYGHSSVTIIGRDKKLLLQYRDNDVPFPNHYNPFGGKHKNGTHDPQQEAIRELKEEIPTLETFINDETIKRDIISRGVWLMPLPKPGEPQLNCEQYISQGYTHWVDWPFFLTVNSAQDIADSYKPGFEGKPTAVTIDDFLAGKITPVSSLYHEVIESHLGRRKPTTVQTWTIGHFKTIMEHSHNANMDAFKPYVEQDREFT